MTIRPVALPEHLAPAADRTAGRRRRGQMRWRLAAVGAAGFGLLGVLIASGLGDSLVYYRTPTELRQQSTPPADRLRVGGLVVPGTVVSTRHGVDFTITDGVHDVRVRHTGAPSGVFAAGQGAIVEGTQQPDGTFRSDTLIVKHSNEYDADRTAADAADAR